MNVVPTILIVLAWWEMFVPVSAPRQQTTAPSQTVELVRLINEWRVSQGLTTLKTDARLEKCAQEHAKDMADNDLLSRTGSDGSQFWDRIKKQGYVRPTGELIAKGAPTADVAWRIFSGSPTHMDFLKRSDLVDIGAGMTSGYWTLDFGSGSPVPRPASPLPRRPPSQRSPLPQRTPQPPQ